MISNQSRRLWSYSVFLTMVVQVWGIKEISSLLNLPKGTVHGLARTLLNTGFLQQNPETRKYQMGMRIYELGAILAGTLEV